MVFEPRKDHIRMHPVPAILLAALCWVATAGAVHTVFENRYGAFETAAQVVVFAAYAAFFWKMSMHSAENDD